MKLGNKKIFLDKPKLSQMYYLRLNGYALKTLSVIFNCDISSIRFQCDKFHVKPVDAVYDIERIISQIIPKPEPKNYKIVNGERINLGKSYQEYLSPYQDNLIKVR